MQGANVVVSACDLSRDSTAFRGLCYDWFRQTAATTAANAVSLAIQ